MASHGQPLYLLIFTPDRDAANPQRMAALVPYPPCPLPPSRSGMQHLGWYRSANGRAAPMRLHGAKRGSSRRPLSGRIKGPHHAMSRIWAPARATTSEGKGRKSVFGLPSGKTQPSGAAVRLLGAGERAGVGCNEEQPAAQPPSWPCLPRFPCLSGTWPVHLFAIGEQGWPCFRRRRISGRS